MNLWFILSIINKTTVVLTPFLCHWLMVLNIRQYIITCHIKRVDNCKMITQLRNWIWSIFCSCRNEIMLGMDKGNNFEIKKNGQQKMFANFVECHVHWIWRYFYFSFAYDATFWIFISTLRYNMMNTLKF